MVGHFTLLKLLLHKGLLLSRSKSAGGLSNMGVRTLDGGEVFHEMAIWLSGGYSPRLARLGIMHSSLYQLCL
jgi:hypothetical protein